MPILICEHCRQPLPVATVTDSDAPHVNEANRCLPYAGKAIFLTPMQTKFLACLVRNPAKPAVGERIVKQVKFQLTHLFGIPQG